MYIDPELNIVHFDSPAEFADACISDPKVMQFDRNAGSSGVGGKAWAGGLTMTEAAAKATRGDDKLVDKAEALMEKYGAEIRLATIMDMPSVAGGYPIVAEALAGEPECMRVPTECADEHAPIHIVVDCASTASINHRQMEARGVAILALVMALAATRPVTLDIAIISGAPKKRRPASGGDCFSILTVRINTTPLDLATSCFMLTEHAPIRQLGYGYKKAHQGFNGDYAKIDGRSFDSEGAFRRSEWKIREYLGITERSLFIPGPRDGDEVIDKPQQWLAKQLAKFAGDMEAQF